MILTHWLNKLTAPAAPARRPAGFRPSVEALGERVNPHASAFAFDSAAPFFAPWSQSGDPTTGTAPAARVATQFAVLASGRAYAGADAAVTVVALDADGRPVRDYAGTVALTSSGTGDALPASYTFTAADRGRHTFTVKAAAVGSDTVTAADAATATIAGKATLDVVAAPVATHLFVETERDVYTGAATRVLVAALDASNRVVPTYAGTVALTSTGTGDTLPAGTTFTAADKGVKVLTFTAAAAGSDTVTATDTATSAVVGSATVTAAAAPAATHLAVVTRHSATAGGASTVYVVALDDSNRVATTYAGTVALTSSDAAATLPAAVTFTAADRGVKAVTLTLPTAGSQTVTATDTATAAVTGNTTVTVRTASASLLGGGQGGLFGGFRRGGRRG